MKSETKLEITAANAQIPTKAYAVCPKPFGRKTTDSPLSAGWALYDPKPLAEMLDRHPVIVDNLLERTGFNKAVRIREEVIKWKTRLIHENRQLEHILNGLNSERRTTNNRLKAVKEQLEGVRNILRIPRESPKT